MRSLDRPVLRYTVIAPGEAYQVAEDYRHLARYAGLRAPAGTTLLTDWASLDDQGTLTLHRGYAWDGPSGPTIDTPDSIRGSAVHDAYYDLIARGLLPESARADADAEFLACLLEDGMAEPRARAWFGAVRVFGRGRSALCRQVLEAPPPPDAGVEVAEWPFPSVG